jgi:hypothetical protein
MGFQGAQWQAFHDTLEAAKSQLQFRWDRAGLADNLGVGVVSLYSSGVACKS